MGSGHSAHPVALDGLGRERELKPHTAVHDILHPDTTVARVTSRA